MNRSRNSPNWFGGLTCIFRKLTRDRPFFAGLSNNKTRVHNHHVTPAMRKPQSIKEVTQIPFQPMPAAPG